MFIQSLEPKIFIEKVEVEFGFFLFYRIKLQLSYKISLVLKIVWLLVNIYSIEPSPDYK